MGAVSFVDEGTEQVLDILQQRAHVNTLFLAVFTYGRGIAGRQVPGQPLPDHGKQQYDVNFHGGNYATVHPEFYMNTVLKRYARSPTTGISTSSQQCCRPPGSGESSTICWLEDVWRGDVPNIERLQAEGPPRPAGAALCLNNPDHRGFLTGLVEDYTRSYEIDGIMWGSETPGRLRQCARRQSRRRARRSWPRHLLLFLLRRERPRSAASSTSPASSRATELEKFVRAARGGKRPVDGHYVAFWRLLLRYPELLAWEHFWHDSLRETYAAIYKTVKSAKARARRLAHLAQQLVQPLLPRRAGSSGTRQVLRLPEDGHVPQLRRRAHGGLCRQRAPAVYGDLPKLERLDFHYRVLNFREREYAADSLYRPLRRLRARETRRARRRSSRHADPDLARHRHRHPHRDRNSTVTPQGRKRCGGRALKAGAHGVLFSRKYSEMKLANLSAAGEAIKQLL